jgi:hypothetical protein
MPVSTSTLLLTSAGDSATGPRAVDVCSVSLKDLRTSVSCQPREHEECMSLTRNYTEDFVFDQIVL